MTSTPISLAIFCGPSLDTVNGHSCFGRAVPPSCPTVGSTKRICHTKELLLTFDVNHVTLNNRRKHA